MNGGDAARPSVRPTLILRSPPCFAKAGVSKDEGGPMPGGMRDASGPSFETHVIASR